MYSMTLLKSEHLQVVFALLGIILLSGIHGIPTRKEVQHAIFRAHEMDTLKRGLRVLGEKNDGQKQCPLARFHGIRKYDDKEMERKALIVLDAKRILMNQQFTLDDLQHETVRSEFARTLKCPVRPDCANLQNPNVRTADGSCNNLNNPLWGMAGQPQLRRFNQVAYDDGLMSPRNTGVDGDPLSNPRTISNEVHKNPLDTETPSATLNLHVFQMGQFLDHDVAATPLSDIEDCCTENPDPSKCFPLIVAKKDEHYDKDYCMNFIRSAAAACPQGDVRQQVNDITSFIDASNVYGSSQEKQNELRDGAFMNTTNYGRRLPDLPPGPGCRANTANNEFCDFAGDFRVNVVPTLTTYHMLFVREHNRIATLMRDMVTDDEELFQKVRRIIIGAMQKIVYEEFLPAILSPGAMNTYGLTRSDSYLYDPNLNPTIANEFGIGWRIGHTWIPQKMSIFRRDFEPYLEVPTEETFEDPALTYYPLPFPGLEGLNWRLTASSAPETDRIMEEAGRSFLFKHDNANGFDAFDLAALNIQRGRDHGLPSYNEFRKDCGLSSYPRDFPTGNEKLPNHTLETTNKLKVYDSPWDIDLWTGAVSETPVPGGQVGPLLECILGKQFHDLKYGDRFWFEGQDVGFTDAQRDEIQRYSMAKILCENYCYETIDYPNVFLKTAQKTKCADIPPLDVNAFAPQQNYGGRSQPKPNQRSEKVEELLDELIHSLDQQENSEN